MHHDGADISSASQGPGQKPTQAENTTPRALESTTRLLARAQKARAQVAGGAQPSLGVAGWRPAGYETQPTALETECAEVMDEMLTEAQVGGTGCSMNSAGSLDQRLYIRQQDGTRDSPGVQRLVAENGALQKRVGGAETRSAVRKQLLHRRGATAADLHSTVATQRSALGRRAGVFLSLGDSQIDLSSSRPLGESRAT
jgi:hypothetical protein